MKNEDELDSVIQDMVNINGAMMGYMNKGTDIKIPVTEGLKSYQSNVYRYNYMLCRLDPTLIKVLKMVLKEVQNGKEKEV